MNLTSSTRPSGEIDLDGQGSAGYDGLDIFDIARMIAEDYLKINETGELSRERVEYILNKLEDCYQGEGCAIDPDDRPERMFILKSLPLISSVTQIGSTISNFNQALAQVEKIYELKQDPFEEATRLSLLIFAYAIDIGYLRFSEGLNFSEDIGDSSNSPPNPEKKKLWTEIRAQVKDMLESKISKLWPPKKIAKDQILNGLTRIIKQSLKEAQKDLAIQGLQKFVKVKFGEQSEQLKSSIEKIGNLEISQLKDLVNKLTNFSTLTDLEKFIESHNRI